MNAAEVSRLLAKCASHDRRKIGEADVIAWLEVLGDLRYADCEQAVIGHYAQTADWSMPAHVRQRVLELRHERLRDTEIPAPPPELLDDPAAYGRAFQAAAIAIADGRDPHAAMAAVAAARHRELEA